MVGERDYIEKVLLDLQTRYDEWQPLQTAADHAAWPILDRIWVENAIIDNDEGKRLELIEAVNRIDEVRNSKKWSPGGKLMYELLVTSLLGLKEKRSRKSQWIAALECAAEQGVSTKPGGFKKWIKLVGGIDGAGELLRGERPDDGESVSLKEAVETLAASVPEAQTITAQLPDASMPEGLALLLVRRKSGENQYSVLGTYTNKSAIERFVAKEIGTTPRKKRNHVQVRNIEERSLLTINRAVLKKAGVSTGKLKAKDITRFQRAVRTLYQLKEVESRYFDSECGYKVIIDDVANSGDMEAVNLDCEEQDPARYISGARPLTLIPYRFDPAKPEANTKAARDYVSKDRKVHRTEPEKRVSNPMVLLTDFVEQDDVDEKGKAPQK